MLGFDYELRRLGFAGNSCQIVLEIATGIDPAPLQKCLDHLARQHPILCSQPARGLTLSPHWKPTSALPQVRVHPVEGGPGGVELRPGGCGHGQEQGREGQGAERSLHGSFSFGFTDGPVLRGGGWVLRRSSSRR
jgi:hypothetical protein